MSELISGNKYQDCYRIVPGYIFIINKFFCNREFESGNFRVTIPRNSYKKLNKGVDDKLWELNKPIPFERVIDSDFSWGIPHEPGEKGCLPAGTVIYNGVPVEQVLEDPHWFTCYSRVQWGGDTGSLPYVHNIMREVKSILEKYIPELNTKKPIK